MGIWSTMLFARVCPLPLALTFIPLWGQIVVREESFMFGLATRFVFNNGECSSSGGRIGTCYTPEECTERNGVAEGTCANGLGVCCIFEINTCGGNVVENCTIVNGTRFDGQNCRFRLEECASGICFFRLDFEVLTLGTVLSSNGDCASDTLDFSSSSVPVLCGSLSGQHIYLPASTTSDDSFNLNFDLSGGVPLTTPYQIQVKQIPCGRSFTPPFGCNQFFFGELAGQFQTFNYNMGTGYHLNNQDYDICVRQEAGACFIAYLAFPAITGFGFSGTGSPFAFNGPADCSEDFVLVPNSANIGSSCKTGSLSPGVVTRYCGSFLSCISLDMVNQPIKTKDFRITVITDGFDAGITTMVGFQLKYQQILCSAIKTPIFG